MGMTLNHTHGLVEKYRGRRAIGALEGDERSIVFLADDPMIAINLVRVVHSFLHFPDDFTLGQLTESYNSLVGDIEDAIIGDEPVTTAGVPDE